MKFVLNGFEGHISIVLSVAFSPDGNYIVSGSRDRTVRLWDVDSKNLVHSFEGHSSWVNSVAFSPNGRYIVSGSSDNTVRFWDVDNKNLVHSFEEHSKSVNSVAFSPDGNYIVSGSEDKTVRLWDVKSKTLVHSFEGHSGWVYSVAFSPDGRYIASGALDAIIRLWDVGSKTLTHSFEGHNNNVLSVAFSPDGRHIVSGSGDRTVKLWDVPKKSFVHSFEGYTGFVNSVAFSPDGRYVISGSADRTVRLWDVNSKTLAHSFEGHNHHVLSVAFSPDGRFIVSGSYRTVRLWDVNSKTLVHSFEGYTGFVNSVAFSPDGRYVVSGGIDSMVKLWDATKKSLVHSFEGHNHDVNSVAFSPDGRYIASGSRDRTVRLWDVTKKKLVYSFEGHSSHVYSVAFSSDGRYIGSKDSKITKFWSIEKLMEIDDPKTEFLNNSDFEELKIQFDNLSSSKSQDPSELEILPTKFAMILNHTTQKLFIMEFKNVYHLLDDVLTKYGHPSSIFRIYDYRPDNEEIKKIQDKLFTKEFILKKKREKEREEKKDKYMNTRTKGTDLDQPIHFTELKRERQNDILIWINIMFESRKTRNTKIGSSRELKQRFEKSEKGFNMTNGQFKGAMIEAGFFPTTRGDQNPYYKIQLMSPGVFDDLDAYYRPIIDPKFWPVYDSAKSRTSSHHEIDIRILDTIEHITRSISVLFSLAMNKRINIQFYTKEINTDVNPELLRTLKFYLDGINNTLSMFDNLISVVLIISPGDEKTDKIQNKLFNHRPNDDFEKGYKERREEKEENDESTILDEDQGKKSREPLFSMPEFRRMERKGIDNLSDKDKIKFYKKLVEEETRQLHQGNNRYVDIKLYDSRIGLSLGDIEFFPESSLRKIKPHSLLLVADEDIAVDGLDMELLDEIGLVKLYLLVSSIPLLKRVSTLKNLKSLIIMESFYPGIPEELSKLTSLTNLSIIDCTLKSPSLPKNLGPSLPKNLGNLCNLKSLILVGCDLTDLPSSVANLKKLNFLNISYNKFTSLPECIAELDNLEILVVESYSHFPLKKIPESYIKLRNLRKIVLNNPDIEIPDEMINNNNLEIKQNSGS